MSEQLAAAVGPLAAALMLLEKSRAMRARATKS
jgi:hypothetical protein